MYFGIDRHVVSSLKLRSIDFDKLESKSNVKKSFQGDVTVETVDRNSGEYRNFTSISISNDERFGGLLLGCKKSGNKKTEYVKMDVFVSEPGGNNLIPLDTIEIMDKHYELLGYIDDEYGIELSDRESKYTYLEINHTVKLEEDSKEYQGLMDIIQYIAPARYKDISIRRDNKDGEIRFISYDNKSMRIKIYNKTRQIKQEKKQELDDLYFRIEICLNDSKKIISVFGTNDVRKITDEMIKDYYKKTIKKDVFDNIDKYIKASDKAIEGKKKEFKKASKTRWTSAICGVIGKKIEFNGKQVDMVFDIEQVKASIRKDIKSKSNYNRTMKTYGKELEEAKHKKNNLVRYQEVKEKILDIN